MTTGVNPITGICNHQTVSYSGIEPSAPLFGQVLETLHSGLSTVLIRV
jgi:hypothetical protein